MEAEIERLYQIVHELSAKLEKIELENVQVNLSIIELNQKYENLRRSLVSGIDV